MHIKGLGSGFLGTSVPGVQPDLLVKLFLR